MSTFENATGPIGIRLVNDYLFRALLQKNNHVLLNNHTSINLEMQVVNHHNWVERSLSYLCREFDSLEHGQDYIHVTPAIHIGILDYTLFADAPEFYATNYLSNIKSHRIYSDFTLIYSHILCPIIRTHSA